MIHYSCDLCGTSLSSSDQRFVLKMDLHPAVSPASFDDDPADVDNLEQLGEMLEELDDFDVDLEEESGQDMRFDLCCDCRKKFLKDPLGRETLLKQLDFSAN